MGERGCGGTGRGGGDWTPRGVAALFNSFRLIRTEFSSVVQLALRFITATGIVPAASALSWSLV